MQEGLLWLSQEVLEYVLHIFLPGRTFKCYLKTQPVENLFTVIPHGQSPALRWDVFCSFWKLNEILEISYSERRSSVTGLL